MPGSLTVLLVAMLALPVTGAAGDPPVRAPSDAVWRGFTHEWQQENHRLNRLGSWIGTDDSGLRTFHAAASGSEDDVADYGSHFTRLEAEGVRFVYGKRTITLEGARENERVTGSFTDVAETDSGERDAWRRFDDYVVLLNGFDVKPAPNLDNPNIQKLQHLELSLRQATYEPSAGGVRVEGNYAVTLNCQSAECNPKPSGGAKLYDYRIDVHYVVVGAEQGALNVVTRSFRQAYDFDRESPVSRARRTISRTITGEQGYPESAVAFRGFSVDLTKEKCTFPRLLSPCVIAPASDDHHMSGWATVLEPTRYSDGTQHLDLALMFKPWKRDMEHRTAMRTSGRASLEAEVALLQLRQQAKVCHGSTRGTHEWPGGGRSGNDPQATSSDPLGSCAVTIEWRRGKLPLSRVPAVNTVETYREHPMTVELSACRAEGRPPWRRERASQSSDSDDLRYTWRAYPRYHGGAPTTKPMAEWSTSECSTEWDAPYEGDFRITVEVTNRAGRSRHGHTDVTVRDFWIVSLGDSYSAGEGNPTNADWQNAQIGASLALDVLATKGAATAAVLAKARKTAEWRNRRCHRSRDAWPAQLADEIQGSLASDRAARFTFLACSGAELEAGMIEPYLGAEPPEGADPLPPQLDRLRDLVRAAGRAPDLVVFSGGGNDVGFADVVTDCLDRGCDEPGKRDRIDPDDEDGDLAKLHPAAGSGSSSPLDRLYERVATDLAGLGVAADDVVVVEYPDVFRNKHEKIQAGCWHATNDASFRWAYENVYEPLNRHVAEAASTHDWHVVTAVGPDADLAAFRKHGYCTSNVFGERWVRRLVASLKRQGTVMGTFHPTRAGHDYMSRQVLGVVERDAMGGYEGPGDVPGLYVWAETPGHDGEWGARAPFALEGSGAATFEERVRFRPIVRSGLDDVRLTLDGEPYQAGTPVSATAGKGAPIQAHTLSVTPELPGGRELPTKEYDFVLRAGGASLLQQLTVEVEDARGSAGAVDGLVSGSLSAGAFLHRVALRPSVTGDGVSIDEVRLRRAVMRKARLRVGEPISTQRAGTPETVVRTPGRYALEIVVGGEHLEPDTAYVFFRVVPDPDAIRSELDYYLRGSRKVVHHDWDESRERFVFTHDRGTQGTAADQTWSFRDRFAPQWERDDGTTIQGVHMELDGEPLDNREEVTATGRHELVIYACHNVLAAPCAEGSIRRDRSSSDVPSGRRRYGGKEKSSEDDDTEVLSPGAVLVARHTIEITGAPDRTLAHPGHAGGLQPDGWPPPAQQPITRDSPRVSLTLIPRIGAFLSGVSTLEAIPNAAGRAPQNEESVLTWGGSLAFGSRDGPVNLRLTAARTAGSLASTEDTDGSSPQAARERILALTGDLVVRPVPRLLLQPYVIGGMGTRRLSVSTEEDPNWDLAAQVGLGVDVRLDDVTLGLEFVDYMTGLPGTDGDLQHDTFIFLHAGVPLF